MTLKEKYKGLFQIGAAVNTSTIRTHRDVIVREFSSLTCENEMKYERVSADGKAYDFSGADAIAAFARENGLQLRMHTLLWHQQTPAAIFQGADRAALLATLQAHTRRMGERYGKQVSAVDVANEVIEDKTDAYYRRTKWHDILGDDFLDHAFRYAAEAMPGVKLCYNDYAECDPKKSVKIYELVKALRDRGVPVTTLGLQAHWNIEEPTLGEMRAAFELYAKLGVSLQITEMDISMYPSRDDPGVDAPSAAMIDRQTQRYSEAFALFRDYAGIIDSVTTWGVADDATWLSNFPVKRRNWPLLFDKDHRPKEAYHAIMDF